VGNVEIRWAGTSQRSAISDLGYHLDKLEVKLSHLVESEATCSTPLTLKATPLVQPELCLMPLDLNGIELVQNRETGTHFRLTRTAPCDC
jgi:hypothetical protein